MLLSFYPRFVKPIENGTKIHTIRDHKRTPKVGETLYMYTGGYNDSRKLIRKDLTLKSIQDLEIDFLWKYENHFLNIRVDGHPINDVHYDAFFINDGFENSKDYKQYLGVKEGRDGFLKMKIFHWTDFKY